MTRPARTSWCCALTLLLGACSDGRPPILIVGIDGLEWSVLGPLMAEGRVPHFEKLAARGVAGSLRTLIPTMSPIVWTTIATGVRARSHGIRDFAEPARVEGDRRVPGLPYTSNCRRVPAIWNIAGDHQREVLSVAWWVSWPAESVPNSRIVASYAAQVQGMVLWKPGVWENGLPELTFPPALQQEIRPLLEAGKLSGPLRAEYAAVFGESLPAGAGWEFPRERERLFRVAYHGDRTHQRIMVRLLRERVADLNLIYIGLPDVAGHFYWRYHESEAYEYPVPPEHVARLGDRLRDTYAVVDAWLGELIAAVPENTRILVISDHGMHAGHVDDPDRIQSGEHEDGPDGVIIAAGAGIARRGILPAGARRIGDILQITPTLLDWLDLPRARDLPGSALRAVMTAAWRRAHPVTETPTYRDGFRRATPPRIPRSGVNREFLEGLEQLGYLDDG